MILKAGILGSGYWARAHARSYQEIEDVELIGVSSRTLKNAKKFAKEFNIKYYFSFEEILNDSEINLVSIALPPYLHSKYTIMAAEKSKHVFCEKPPAISIKELKEVIEIIEKKKIQYLVGYIERFNPVTRKIKEFLSRRIIGKIKFIYSSRMGLIGETDWKLKEKTGGGILNLHTSHDLDLIPWLLDTKVKCIYCSMNKLYSPAYDNIIINLKTKNNIEGVIRSDLGWVKGERLIQLIGTKGSIYADYRKSFIELWDNGLREKKLIVIKKKVGLNLEIDYWVKSIKDSDTNPFLIKKEQLIHGLQLITKSYESNQKKSMINID
jgi:UDP-N-acetylglucosamine 3-dehydrogenase